MHSSQPERGNDDEHSTQGQRQACPQPVRQAADEGSDDRPEDGVDTGDGSNLGARSTEIPGERQYKDGEHTNGGGTIGKIDACNGG